MIEIESAQLDSYTKHDRSKLLDQSTSLTTVYYWKTNNNVI
jgi:hypothetical protein